MAKEFSRSLLLCSGKTSLYKALSDILQEISDESRTFDVSEKLDALSLRANSQLFRMPYYIRNRWEKYFLKKVNTILLEEFNRHNPDLVLVYNS